MIEPPPFATLRWEEREVSTERLFALIRAVEEIGCVDMRIEAETEEIGWLVTFQVTGTLVTEAPE